jgi:hypothetical protein
MDKKDDNRERKSTSVKSAIERETVQQTQRRESKKVKSTRRREVCGIDEGEEKEKMKREIKKVTKGRN